MRLANKCMWRHNAGQYEVSILKYLQNETNRRGVETLCRTLRVHRRYTHAVNLHSQLHLELATINSFITCTVTREDRTQFGTEKS